MKQPNQLHQRQTFRYPGYDYRQSGAYVVTICTDNRQCVFGDINQYEMNLSPAGLIVEKYWKAIPDHFPQVHLDHFVIMPNHLHGILVITEDKAGDACIAPTSTGQPQHLQAHSLAAIIGSFKSVCTKEVRQLLSDSTLKLWQRSYYETILRNEDSLFRFREYIINSPAQWELDELNPSNF